MSLIQRVRGTISAIRCLSNEKYKIRKKEGLRVFIGLTPKAKRGRWKVEQG